MATRAAWSRSTALGRPMGLTSALNTSLNGLTLNETSIDVLGNNIANAGTTGFKSSRVLFTTQLSRTLSVGSRPTAESGGSNPRQVGLGATTAAISKDFTQGSVTASTSPSDLAIQGDGFFVLDGPTGRVYSRSGNFHLNSQDLLTNPQGLLIQGYTVDDDFNLITTELSNINIPLGDLNVAQQTQDVTIGGALLPTGEVAVGGSVLTSSPLTNTAGGNAAVDPITPATLLTSVFPDGSAAALFNLGDTIDYVPETGGRSLEPQALQVGVTTTVADLLTMMDHGLGLQSGGTIPNDATGVQPGLTVTAGGEIHLVGNMGTDNTVKVPTGSLTISGTTVPLAFTESQTATGESTTTEFAIFGSLGAQINVQLTAVLESVTTSSTTFRYFFESADDSDTDIAIHNGTISFDGNGQITSGGTTQMFIDRNATAAVSPMQVRIDFADVSGISSTESGSTLALQSQNGSSPGTLTSFVIDETGVINGVFDNGIIRTLGQVTLARFSNPQGLLDDGNTSFTEGVSSGPPFLATPGNFGAGSIRAGSIEVSNTDIGENLVDLIVASTNYRGNARVISSVQQLIDELLILGR